MEILLTDINSNHYAWIVETLTELKATIIEQRFKVENTVELFIPDQPENSTDTQIKVKFPDLNTFLFFKHLYKNRESNIRKVA